MSCDNKYIYDANQSTANVLSSYPYENCYANWYKSIGKHFATYKYSYDESLNNYVQTNPVSSNIFSENDARTYIDKNRVDYIEGIWEVTGQTNYRLFIKKEKYKRWNLYNWRANKNENYRCPQRYE